jgi:hypothetical protein
VQKSSLSTVNQPMNFLDALHCVIVQDSFIVTAVDFYSLVYINNEHIIIIIIIIIIILKVKLSL